VSLRVHGGLHSVSAARTCYRRYKEGAIKKELYDPRWENYPCRVYLFDQTIDDVEKLVHMLGHEDNQSYQKETPFYEYFRYLRKVFLKTYARRDEQGKLDPMERWPEFAPKPFDTLREYRYEFQKHIMATLSKKYKNKTKTANQICAFVTRSKPINDLIWNILRGHYNAKGKRTKKEIDGVSTFCHLQGVGDDTHSMLNQVFIGEITLDQMRLRLQKLKGEKRCFRAAIDYIQKELAIHNVRCIIFYFICFRFVTLTTSHSMASSKFQRKSFHYIKNHSHAKCEHYLKQCHEI
jgi:hypothetical protein